MKKLAPFIVMIALFVLVIPVSAKRHERIGEKLSIWPGSPTTFAAETPFHIAHGWQLFKIDGPVGRYDFTLEIDGEMIAEDFVERSVERGPDGRAQTRVWVFNFPDGMTGTHTFTGHWIGPCQYVTPGPCPNPNAKVEAFTNTLTVEFLP